MQGNTLLTLGGAALLAFLDVANAQFSFEDAADDFNNAANDAADDLRDAAAEGNERAQEALDRRMGCNNLQDYQCDVDTSSLRGALENSSCGCEFNTLGYAFIFFFCILPIVLIIIGIKKNNDAAKKAALGGGSYTLDSYCGILSCLLGYWCFPCGLAVACCPVDKRAIPVKPGQTVIYTTAAHDMSRQLTAAPAPVVVGQPYAATTGMNAV